MLIVVFFSFLSESSGLWIIIIGVSSFLFYAVWVSLVSILHHLQGFLYTCITFIFIKENTVFVLIFSFLVGWSVVTLTLAAWLPVPSSILSKKMSSFFSRAKNWWRWRTSTGGWVGRSVMHRGTDKFWAVAEILHPIRESSFLLGLDLQIVHFLPHL